MATKPPRLYVPLDVDYADDEAIAEVSPLAELLYLRCLCVAKKAPSRAGFLTRADIAFAARGKVRTPARLTAELVETGLLIAEDRAGQPGWRIRSWATWNMTETQVENQRQAVTRGGYIRAHKANQHHEHPNESCPLCQAGSSATTSARSSATTSAGRLAKRREEKVIPPTGVLPNPTPGVKTPVGGPPPTPYLYDPTRPEEGGWDGPNAWINPTTWRTGHTPGTTPPPPTSDTP